MCDDDWTMAYKRNETFAYNIIFEYMRRFS